ncbi:hypothetical protein PAT3040_02347 [Paenibacillus agaridevorans]|uniref:HTH gntR-type domain-containing protein n=1 Tax=Paenibacillus agaridevorans TaxID=171404 RepID=A0A2R5EM82_9BACL|nr:GntR family transcriptional regulator [Paenibacillus agaridevorans]GBG07786.1 hypothetical protein PAT3040_02347 [Paenibacillus agaridevorans]
MESESPKYSQIKQYIVQKINQGDFRPHDQIPTEFMLSEKFGVSRITSNRAIRELEMEGYIYRTRGKGSFVASPNDRLAGAGTEYSVPDAARRVAVIFADVQHHQYGYTTCMEILLGAQRVLAEYGYDVSIFFSDESEEQEQRLITAASSGQFSGFLLLPLSSNHEQEELKRLNERRFPFVVIDRTIRTLRTNLVTSDNFDGAYQAVSYLIEQGHRNIAFLSLKIDYASSVHERYRGYCEALSDHRIPLRRELVMEDYIPANMAAITERLLEQIQSPADKVTAVFAINDEIAIDVMKALPQRGVAIPEDVSLIGFDDSPMLDHVSIPLSSVKQFRKRLGEQAGEMLIRHIEDNELPLEHVMLNTKLVVRKSTGKAK